jgi:hypothetical protein
VDALGDARSAMACSRVITREQREPEVHNNGYHVTEFPEFPSFGDTAFRKPLSPKRLVDAAPGQTNAKIRIAISRTI